MVPANMRREAGAPSCSPTRLDRVGWAARYALAGIRVVNGAVALIAPTVIIRRLGEHPQADAAAVYGLRLFGVRTVLIGLDLVTLSGAPLRRALGQAVIIHGTDTATAACLCLSGRLRPRMAVPLILISATNTGLAVSAYLSARRDKGE